MSYEELLQQLADGLKAAGLENMNPPKGMGDQEARDWAMSNVAEPIAKAIHDGVKITIKGSATVSQINSLRDKAEGDVWGVKDSGCVVNPGQDPLSVSAGDLIVWNGEKWEIFLHLDLSGYVTEDRLNIVVSSLSAAITAEATARANADTALGERIDSEASARASADATLQGNIDAEATAREGADATLQSNIESEETAREQADSELQAQIDAISSKSDVVDVVASYVELVAYDTSALGDNDVIKVLEDETHDDAITYYRWVAASEAWSFIGSQGPYYTISEADALLAGRAPTNHSSTATTYGVGDATHFGHVKVDSALSNSSTNPVQNKVVKSALDGKVPTNEFDDFRELVCGTPGYASDSLAIANLYIQKLAIGGMGVHNKGITLKAYTFVGNDEANATLVFDSTTLTGADKDYFEKGIRRTYFTTNSGETIKFVWTGDTKHYFRALGLHINSHAGSGVDNDHLINARFEIGGSSYETFGMSSCGNYFTFVFNDSRTSANIYLVPAKPTNKMVFSGARSLTTYGDSDKVLNGTSLYTYALNASRNLKVNLASESAQSFDGSANAENIGVTGTLPITHGGTGKTNANDAANALINGLPLWSADVTDSTQIIRQDNAGTATFGRVPGSAMWNYIKGKVKTWLGIGTDDVLPITHGGTGATTAANARTNLGLGNVENESVSNGTPDFTEATTRANIASGEKMSVLFGKIKKWLTDLKALAFKDKVSDGDINGTISDSHIASASTWNGKANADGSNATGTWGIDVTGNAAKSTQSGKLSITEIGDTHINLNDCTANDGCVHYYAWSDRNRGKVANKPTDAIYTVEVSVQGTGNLGTYVIQKAYRRDSDEIYVRRRSDRDPYWSSWKRLVYGDGSNASGTWGINISGNAATASALSIPSKGNNTTPIYYNGNSGQFELCTPSSMSVGIATEVVDYGNTSLRIKIGYSGAALSSTSHLAAYTTINGQNCIKDISPSNVTVGNATKWNGYNIVVGSLSTNANTISFL